MELRGRGVLRWKLTRATYPNEGGFDLKVC